MSKKKTNDEVPEEHKRPWQEMYATVEEIKTFLADRIYLRHNVVTGRTECRVPERDWFGEDGTVIQEWQPISDRVVNSLWAELSKAKMVRPQDIYRVMESDFVPDFNPLPVLSGPAAAVGW